MSAAGIKFEYIAGQPKPWRSSLRGRHYGEGVTIHDALDSLAAQIEDERAEVAKARATLPKREEPKP